MQQPDNLFTEYYCSGIRISASNRNGNTTIATEKGLNLNLRSSLKIGDLRCSIELIEEYKVQKMVVQEPELLKSDLFDPQTRTILKSENKNFKISIAFGIHKKFQTKQ